MYNFEYVSKKEAAPAKNELIEIINGVQKILRNKDISFQFQFIGSSSRNMITCDRSIDCAARTNRCYANFSVWNK